MNSDEIVKALRATVWVIGDCGDNRVLAVMIGHMTNAADLIESLQAQLAAKDAQISQLAAGRDAAVDDILIAVDEGKCSVCKHATRDDGPRTQICEKWPNRECWEWCGAGEEKP